MQVQKPEVHKNEQLNRKGRGLEQWTRNNINIPR